MKSSSANSTVDRGEPLARPLDAVPLPLHVLTLTPFFPSLENEVGGCFIKEPIDALARIGVAATVIGVRPVYNRRPHPSPEAPAKWIRYPQLPGTVGLSSAGRFLYARLFAEVSRAHRNRSIDVIHAHAALPCGHAAFLLGQRLGIPYVVTVHGLDVFNTCFVGGAAAEWRRATSIAVYRNAGRVVCVSRRVERTLQNGMPGAVHSTVVHNGTDVELFSPQPTDRGAASVSASNALGQDILVVGNLIPSKGQEIVLRAIHRISDAFPQLQCRIVGEGPDRRRLEALANELGISQRIHFVGRQSRAAVANAMRACSMFVLPSSSEGLGCVYLEAMACAKPVIACRGQGIEEIIEHGKNGWLITPDHLPELEQAISVLLNSPKQAGQIGIAARQTILNGATLAHQAQSLATVYRLCAPGRAL